MRYHLSLPARINILGNPTDANEGDFATISAAVELRANAVIEGSEGIVLESVPLPGICVDQTITRQVFYQDPPLPYNDELDLVKGAINQLYKFSNEFRQKLPKNGVQITTWSEVPRQSGLGGSSLFVLLALAGLREFYDLDRQELNNYVLAELAQRVEAKELKITCGFADRYVPIFGGIAYMDFRGKLYQHEIKQEPYVTYERLDEWIDMLPLVVITTGIQHDSGEVHGRMRPLYIEQHNLWTQEGGEPPPLVQLMLTVWETAWKGKIALLEGDLETVGHLMNENHHLVNKMMTQCGFEDGAGWANNLMIEKALENGALGAKLTGAGGGGSVFALVKPGDQERLERAWVRAAEEYGMEKTEVFRPKIAHRGLVVERIE
ncbi:MAG: hypothetical protein U9R58_07320 [Chloroflexota bacterium]|nr:hypothetical protein [Chloroflexota bacterium]